VEGWKPGHLVCHGNRSCGNRRLRDSLGWLIVNADDCLNVKRRDFISQKPVPQLGYRGRNDAFGVSLASMSFRDCNARVEAWKAVHRLNRDHNRQSRHRLTIKPHIGEGTRLAPHRSSGHQIDGGSLADIFVVRSATKWLRLYG
jgi:hypothetical protein